MISSFNKDLKYFKFLIRLQSTHLCYDKYQQKLINLSWPSESLLSESLCCETGVVDKVRVDQVRVDKMHK